MSQRVFVIYTGGTIGMQPSGGPGTPLQPVPNYLSNAIRGLSELDPARTPNAPEVEVLEYDELIDSSDMRPEIWVQIARDIETRYAEFDGFVVVHGTDTMAYTSSALSFLVEATTKPIVVTGAQLPFGVPRSDARNNLVTAIHVAASMPPAMAQVCVVFGSKVLRGNRVTKVSASAFDAFDSPRFPPLANVGITVEWDRRLGLEHTLDAVRFFDKIPPNDAVAVLRIFPGFQGGIIRALLQNEHLRAIVLEGYGSGNGPSADADFLGSISEARASGVVVAVVAQPAHARVRLENYAAGHGLVQAGAVGLAEMTTEAALTKLYFLLATFDDPDEIERRIVSPIAGEMDAEWVDGVSG